MSKKTASTLLTLLIPVFISAQSFVPLTLGNFDQWLVRHIKESKLLGGHTKTIYAIAPTDTLYGNSPFNGKGTIWATSNVYASPAGISKGSNSVEPERRGNGFCARMDAKFEEVKVIGIINVKLAIAGSIFVGRMYEPIKSANDPYKNMDFGIAFTKRPKALVFDYKCTISPEHTRAIGAPKTVPGHDCGVAYIYLQKRWEDESGNIYAKRVGTGFHQFTQTVATWQNAFHVPIKYGDISHQAGFQQKEGLGTPFHTRNSKGKMVPIQEIGWADADETPTHLIIMFSTSCCEAFLCHIGNSLWIDNVGLEY